MASMGSMRVFAPSKSTAKDENGSVAFIFCPSNFSTTEEGNSKPQIGTSYVLHTRRAEDWNRSAEPGLGLFPTDLTEPRVFHGWVRPVDKHILFNRVKSGHKIILTVTEMEPFFWPKAGGECYSGRGRFEDLGVEDGYIDMNED